MFDLESLVQLTGSYGPVIAIAIATFLVLEIIMRAVARRMNTTAAINSQLRLREKVDNAQEALVEVRRRRGLTAEGGYSLPIETLNRLLLQSGMQLRLGFLLGLMAAIALIIGLITTLLGMPIPIRVLLAAAAGIGTPLLVLSLARSRRLKKLEEQLPEAVDVMVRSLRAGHPIPVAVNMVGREMSDPAGSEFAMVADEMTYGLDLTTALGNLRERTGQMDVALLVVAVSIQSKTGGNLAELLSKLGKMIRERSRMRRKIKALSAEGRFSSIALIIVPIVVYLIVNTLAPTFYGDVKDDPIFMPSVYFGLGLWVVGIFVIRRMVNFKF